VRLMKILSRKPERGAVSPADGGLSGHRRRKRVCTAGAAGENPSMSSQQRELTARGLGNSKRNLSTPFPRVGRLAVTEVVSMKRGRFQTAAAGVVSLGDRNWTYELEKKETRNTSAAKRKKTRTSRAKRGKNKKRPRRPRLKGGLL